MHKSKAYRFDSKVRNIWFLVSSRSLKQENLVLLSLYIFEESVFICQFLNDKIHNYAKNT